MEQERRETEQREYEQKLFEKDINKQGNMSEFSQQSNESMSQYDQLENVYAPSATPCYDTPGHNNDSQPPDPSKMCYVDVSMEGDKMEQENQVDQQHNETSIESHTSRKRNIDASDACAVDAKRSKQVKETDQQSRTVVDKHKRRTRVKEESSGSVNENEKKSEERNKNAESNTRSVIEESRDEDFNCRENKKVSRPESKEGKAESGSRNLNEEEQTERQRCELTSDNT